MATVNPAIREPSVDIFQRVAATAAATPKIGLASVCIAANYFWMRAQESGGSWNSDALMGTYEDDDATYTYALPNLEDGSVFDADSLEVFLKIGSNSTQLDDTAGETVVISSDADSCVYDGSAYYDLIDSIQVFSGVTGSGIVAGGDPADYVVRMRGEGKADDYDFTIAVVATTTLSLNPTPDGIAPSSTVLDYQVILNPAKFVVNADAEEASLRINSATAALTVPGNVGGQADMTFTANPAHFPGNDGNAITITITDTGVLGVTVTGLAIVITIDGAGNGNTTTGTVLKNYLDTQATFLYLASAAVGATPTGVAGTTILDNLEGGSHLEFTAVTAGLASNLLRVKYALPAGDPSPLALQLNGNDLTVSLANTGGVAVSTDTEIAAAIALNVPISALFAVTAGGGTGVPTAALAATYTNLTGGFDENSVTLDANLIGTTNVAADVYVEYRALSRKWTSEASTATTGNEPQMVSASDVTTLEALVGELTDDNPLGLMMYLALQNAPGGTVFGLGVDSVHTLTPDGTDAAWDRAIDFMESEQPYYFAIGSQRTAVHNKWILFNEYMNGDGVTTPAVMESFLFINKALPTYTPDELLANEDDDLTIVGAGPGYTASENFQILGVQAGDVLVVGTGTVGPTTLQNGLKGYIVDAHPVLPAVDPAPYTLSITSMPGTGYPATPTAQDWALYRPGVVLQSGGLWLKDLMAETVSQINAAIGNRKVSSTFPDNVTLTVDGSLKSVEGFFGDAAQAGQCSAQPVSQSKLRQSLVGIDSIRYSSDFFSNQQLDVIQGGGTWVRHIVVPGGAVQTRHALTTDTTSPLTYNPTSAWQVDKYARLIRSSVRRTLGATITIALIDDIAMKMDQVGRHMIDTQELARATINSISQGDGVLVPIDNIVVNGEAAPLQPNNGIKFYLTIAGS